MTSCVFFIAIDMSNSGTEGDNGKGTSKIGFLGMTTVFGLLMSE